MMDEKKLSRTKLRAKLKEQLECARVGRSSKKNKEQILDKTLKGIGIDKERLKKDMEAVKQQGG